MSRESALRQRICTLLREHNFVAQPIESSTTAEGVPDLWYASPDRNQGWLELKKVKQMPVRPNTAVFTSLNHPLSIEQANWINKARQKTTIHILVGYGREYFLVPAVMASTFNTLTEAGLRKYQIDKKELPAILNPLKNPGGRDE